MVSTLDTCCRIKFQYLSNDINTKILVDRIDYLRNKISQLRARYINYNIYDVEVLLELTNLYGEYVYVNSLLTNNYIETFYLHSESDKKVFISHSSHDKALALELATDLKMAGYNIWLDIIDLKLGQSIPKEITNELDKSDAFLMLVSEEYKKSFFCNDEWEAYYMAFNSKKPNAIIPIMLDETQPPILLSAKKYYRYKYLFYEYSDMLLEIKKALKYL